MTAVFREVQAALGGAHAGRTSMTCAILALVPRSEMLWPIASLQPLSLACRSSSLN